MDSSERAACEEQQRWAAPIRALSDSRGPAEGPFGALLDQHVEEPTHTPHRPAFPLAWEASVPLADDLRPGGSGK